MGQMFLVRHGATAENLSQPTVLQGNGIDGPLAEQGRGQARQTAELLSRFKFAAIYTSPMRRARETAEILARPHALPITNVPEIVEVDVGRWQGRDWESIARDDPQAYRLHLEDPSVHPYGDGESASDVAARAVPALLALLQQNAGRRILVVAHNIVNRVLIAHLAQIPLRQMRVIRQDNCCVNRIDYHQDQAELVTVNSTFHLDS